MTLVERLRAVGIVTPDGGPDLHLQAADRVELLESAISGALNLYRRGMGVDAIVHELRRGRAAE